LSTKAILAGAALTGLLLGMSGCSSSSTNSGSEVVGECHGMNSCKSTGACGGKGHSCAGQNKCKGQGWLKLSKKDCLAKKGTFKEQ